MWYRQKQLNTSGFIHHVLNIIYIFGPKVIQRTKQLVNTHNYCEQAVIRLYYIGTECNNIENTS